MLTILLLLTLSADWPLLVASIQKQVVRLEMLTEGDGDEPGICSGVVLNAVSGWLLTAAHCVDHPVAKGFSMTVNGRHATAVKVNQILDLAVVKFDPKGEEAMTLAESTPPVGSELAIVGFPFGDDHLAVQFGRVAQVFNIKSKMLWLNADVLGGNSGGAVIDTQGRLIGLTSRVFYNGPSHLGGAVPIEAIAAFVKGYLPEKK